MSISEEQVRHVALLARLALTDEQVHTLSDQLSGILGHIETMRELDLGDVPPTSHAIAVTNAMREDAVKPCLPRDLALKNAPEQREGAFLIPTIVGPGGEG